MGGGSWSPVPANIGKFPADITDILGISANTSAFFTQVDFVQASFAQMDSVQTAFAQADSIKTAFAQATFVQADSV